MTGCLALDIVGQSQDQLADAVVFNAPEQRIQFKCSGPTPRMGEACRATRDSSRETTPNVPSPRDRAPAQPRRRGSRRASGPRKARRDRFRRCCRKRAHRRTRSPASPSAATNSGNASGRSTSRCSAMRSARTIAQARQPPQALDERIKCRCHRGIYDCRVGSAECGLGQ